MDIAVEISLYPLESDYIPAIRDFIDRLAERARHEPGVKVVTNSLSTQVFGGYEQVFRLLGSEIGPTFDGGKRVFVMKVIGPYGAPAG